MRISLGAAGVAVGVLVLLLAACGGASDVAEDPADRDADAAPPTAVPAAPGEVRTRGVVTVRDDGTRPEVCLGPVAESWPPQCEGVPLVGWDWRRERLVLGQPGDGDAAYQQASGVRWGRYALVGRWDGASFTLGTAVPEAQYEPPSEEAEPLQEPERHLGEPALQALADRLAGRLPGVLTTAVDDGRVHVEVIYDDGTLQEWADTTHGAGVVVLTSALVEVGG